MVQLNDRTPSRSDLHNTFLVTGECDVGFPQLPVDFGGSPLNAGIQIIAEGPTFNDSANVTALHLGGVCAISTFTSRNCIGEFQIWRRSESDFSLLHRERQNDHYSNQGINDTIKTKPRPKPRTQGHRQINIKCHMPSLARQGRKISSLANLVGHFGGQQFANCG